MWAPSRVAFFYLRPAGALPLVDFLLVALERAALGFLATETQLMQEPRDMTAVELDLTVLLYQGADSPGSPQLGAKAIGDGTFQQQPDELLTLSTRQCWRPTRRESHLQRFLPAALGSIPPTHHRARHRPEHAADLVERETLPE